MARTYGEKFLIELYKNETQGLGITLAKLCVSANLPAAYVAKALDISRMTIYNWFRGDGVREVHRAKVETFMDLVKADMDAGELPAKGNIDAKLYIDKMLGTSP
jgi:hypothetical protein